MNENLQIGIIFMTSSIFFFLSFQNILKIQLKEKKQTSTSKTSTLNKLKERERYSSSSSSSSSSCSPLFNSSLFSKWCKEIYNKIKNEEEFKIKIRKRNILSQNNQEILLKKQNLLEAEKEWEKHIQYNNYLSLKRKLIGIQGAITSMESFLNEDNSQVSDPSKLEKIHRTKISIETKRNELLTTEDEYNQILLTPEYQAVERYKKELDDYIESLGLNELNKSLTKVQKHKGGQKSKRGYSFEDQAALIIKNDLIQLISERYSTIIPNFNIENILIVRNITFGMASVTGSPGEFDIFICLRTSPWSIDSMTNSNVKSNKTIKNIPKDSSKYYNCQVLAVIEVKRNIDDIGTAFSGLQPAITWLTGNKTLYNSSEWINKNYPSGHFDRPYFHSPDCLVFTSESFNLIASNIISLETGYCYARDVFFVTRDEEIDNISSKEFNVITHRLTSDIEFDDNLSDENALEKLRLSIISSHIKEYTTSEVINLLLSLQLDNQIIVVGKE